MRFGLQCKHGYNLATATIHNNSSFTIAIAPRRKESHIVQILLVVME